MLFWAYLFYSLMLIIYAYYAYKLALIVVLIFSCTSTYREISTILVADKCGTTLYLSVTKLRKTGSKPEAIEQYSLLVHNKTLQSCISVRVPIILTGQDICAYYSGIIPNAIDCLK